MRTTAKKFIVKGLTLACISFCSGAFASDFSLPFVSVSGLGTSYSDWTTAASDASTSYTNPAGLAFLNQHQQFVLAPMAILGSTKFTGTAITPPFPMPGQIVQRGSASSQIRAFLPSMYYSIPLNERTVLAFGETTPFALGTTYAANSIVRYSAIRSRIIAANAGPSIGFRATKQLAVGLGFDVSRLLFTLTNAFGPPITVPDSQSQNNFYGWGYGWHAGTLYEALPTTRFGLSFNSMIMYHAGGNSTVFTPFGAFRTTASKSYSALPARTQFSFQHDLTPLWTVMGTVFYTNWSTLGKVVERGVILPGGRLITVTIPLNYHNTFDYSIGTTYKVTEKWLLRTGINFLQTPTNNRNRGVADPVGSATIPAIGAHYQQNPYIGYDVGYTHSFFRKMSVNNTNVLTRLVGHNEPQTNVFGAQVTWNIT